jgi:hypothetical protein
MAKVILRMIGPGLALPLPELKGAAELVSRSSIRRDHVRSPDASFANNKITASL